MAGAESGVLDTLSKAFPLGQLEQCDRAMLVELDAALVHDFVRAAYREVKNSPHAGRLLHEICARVRVSEFSIRDWISDILGVYRFLETQGRRAHLIDVVEYVGCALEGSSHQIGHSIAWYLEQHGFERSWVDAAQR